MVGSGLCKDLLAAGRPRIFILTRNRSRAPELLSGLTEVIVLEGDITVPQLGLAPDVYKSLQCSVTEIVHCAANTRFGLSLDAIRTPNVTGTRNMLDFALGCRRLEKFVHISTAYVAGRTSGRIPEEVNQHRHGFFNTYQQSKYEAEVLVLDAMKRLPAIIVRFSSIIGDSRTGEVTGFNHVHQLLRLFPRSVLPVAPGHPDAPIDLVPTEWAVGALSHLVTSAFSAGQVYHLCSGPQKSFTVAEMMRTTLALFENHPIGRTWLPIELPELISLPEFELFVEKSRRKGDKLLSALLTALGYFLPHLATFQYFENQRAAKALETSAVALPHAREYYPKVVEYCLSANWIGKRKGHDSGPLPPPPSP
jgi:nucleoside-diphosphate-sugar epimerase